VQGRSPHTFENSWECLPKLKEQLDFGDITQEEFDQKKKELQEDIRKRKLPEEKKQHEVGVLWSKGE